MDHLQLLRELKVKRIYWVDDHNATIEDLDLTQLTELLIDRLVSESIEDINICIKTFKEREPKVTRRAAKAIQDARTRQEQENVDPTSSIKDAVEKMIESLSTTISPSELVNDALRAFPTRFTESEKKTLAEAFMAKGDWEWFPISFTDWSKRHADILGDHNTLENAALLIVDLQNDREKTSVDGKGVLENWAHWVTSSNSMRSVFAIAFTDRFRPEDEIKEGRNYTNNLFTAPLKQQLPVLVLSKARLKSDHNRGSGAQEAFKRALGRLRACLLHWDLASDLEGLFSQSVADAFKDLQELSIEELLMGVSGGHTLQEGASDVDTLIRLAAIAQRGALLSRIADNENTAKILLELRGLAEIFKDYGSANLADRAGIAKLRASEVHDPASVVNKLFPD